ncbi:MAG: hypothetical protein IJ852_00080 [Alphaproteobacteria bacterium]|nr:hypothetical protein [Alphaproteobacteria bacterium]
MNFMEDGISSLWNFINSQSLLNTLIHDRFILMCLVLFLLRFKYATYKNIFLTALINIPGTILHELAHFLIGFLLNAQPTSFSLFPKKSGNAYVTGSVSFRHIKFYNAFPSAMAPLLLLPIAYWFDKYYFANVHTTVWNYLFYVLLQTVLIENAIPSHTDFKVAFSSLSGTVFYTLLIIGIFAFFL